LWTRFIPATEAFLDLLREKAIGELLFMHADFGFKTKYDVNGRLYDKKLGGGSLLDIGIYPIYLSLITLGIPSEIKAMARMTDTNVDSYCSMLFDFESSAKAILESTIEANTRTEATIYGKSGTIKLHRRFHHTEKLTLNRNGVSKIFEIPYLGNGYLHEIQEVNYCLDRGDKESSKLPLSISLDLISVIDRVKKEIGLSYPGKLNV
jgi:predicted dehydrogenase